MKFDWREQWDEKRDELERYMSDITPVGESMTQQAHAADADINIIMQRMGVTDGATIPVAPIDPRLTAEVDDSLDLRAVLDIAKAASDHFAMLPVTIRRRFNFNPAEMAEWLHDPNNTEEAVSLGLLRDLKAEEREALKQRHDAIREDARIRAEFAAEQAKKTPE